MISPKQHIVLDANKADLGQFFIRGLHEDENKSTGTAGNWRNVLY